MPPKNEKKSKRSSDAETVVQVLSSDSDADEKIPAAAATTKTNAVPSAVNTADVDLSQKINNKVAHDVDDEEVALNFEKSAFGDDGDVEDDENGEEGGDDDPEQEGETEQEKEEEPQALLLQEDQQSKAENLPAPASANKYDNVDDHHRSPPSHQDSLATASSSSTTTAPAAAPTTAPSTSTNVTNNATTTGTIGGSAGTITLPQLLAKPPRDTTVNRFVLFGFVRFITLEHERMLAAAASTTTSSSANKSKNGRNKSGRAPLLLPPALPREEVFSMVMDWCAEHSENYLGKKSVRDELDALERAGLICTLGGLSGAGTLLPLLIKELEWEDEEREDDSEDAPRKSDDQASARREEKARKALVPLLERVTFNPFQQREILGYSQAINGCPLLPAQQRSHRSSLPVAIDAVKQAASFARPDPTHIIYNARSFPTDEEMRRFGSNNGGSSGARQREDAEDGKRFMDFFVAHVMSMRNSSAAGGKDALGRLVQLDSILHKARDSGWRIQHALNCLDSLTVKNQLQRVAMQCDVHYLEAMGRSNFLSEPILLRKEVFDEGNNNTAARDEDRHRDDDAADAQEGNATKGATALQHDRELLYEMTYLYKTSISGLDRRKQPPEIQIPLCELQARSIPAVLYFYWDVARLLGNVGAAEKMIRKWCGVRVSAADGDAVGVSPLLESSSSSSGGASASAAEVRPERDRDELDKDMASTMMWSNSENRAACFERLLADGLLEQRVVTVNNNANITGSKQTTNGSSSSTVMMISVGRAPLVVRKMHPFRHPFDTTSSYTAGNSGGGGPAASSSSSSSSRAAAAAAAAATTFTKTTTGASAAAVVPSAPPQWGAPVPPASGAGGGGAGEKGRHDELPHQYARRGAVSTATVNPYNQFHRDGSEPELAEERFFKRLIDILLRSNESDIGGDRRNRPFGTISTNAAVDLLQDISKQRLNMMWFDIQLRRLEALGYVRSFTVHRSGTVKTPSVIVLQLMTREDDPSFLRGAPARLRRFLDGDRSRSHARTPPPDTRVPKDCNVEAAVRNLGAATSAATAHPVTSHTAATAVVSGGGGHDDYDEGGARGGGFDANSLPPETYPVGTANFDHMPRLSKCGYAFFRTIVGYLPPSGKEGESKGFLTDVLRARRWPDSEQRALWEELQRDKVIRIQHFPDGQGRQHATRFDNCPRNLVFVLVRRTDLPRGAFFSDEQQQQQQQQQHRRDHDSSSRTAAARGSGSTAAGASAALAAPGERRAASLERIANQLHTVSQRLFRDVMRLLRPGPTRQSMGLRDLARVLDGPDYDYNNKSSNPAGGRSNPRDFSVYPKLVEILDRGLLYVDEATGFVELVRPLGGRIVRPETAAEHAQHEHHDHYHHHHREVSLPVAVVQQPTLAPAPYFSAPRRGDGEFHQHHESRRRDRSPPSPEASLPQSHPYMQQQQQQQRVAHNFVNAPQVMLASAAAAAPSVIAPPVVVDVLVASRPPAPALISSVAAVVPLVRGSPLSFPPPMLVRNGRPVLRPVESMSYLNLMRIPPPRV